MMLCLTGYISEKESHHNVLIGNITCKVTKENVVYINFLFYFEMCQNNKTTEKKLKSKKKTLHKL